MTGRDATEDRLRDLLHNYKYVHFATHNLINDRQPLYSKIVLSRPNDDSTEDGYLHTYELFNQRLGADLVVLSACNSGLGQFRQGEGIIGLSHAFMFAGVPSLVVSLWPVEDETTAFLMNRFYDYLALGSAQSVALQKAKLDLMNSNKEKNTPFYWAPFVLMGATGSQ